MKKIYSLLLMFPMMVCAAEADFTIVIKEHRFQPSELVIPEGKKVKILIVNQDSTPEEFESHSLNREKVIAANSSASIYVGPLDAGSYKFFGEFNEATAQGVIIAK